MAGSPRATLWRSASLQQPPAAIPDSMPAGTEEAPAARQGACGAHADAVQMWCRCGADAVQMRCACGRLTRGATRPPPRPPAHRSRPAAPRERLLVSLPRQAAPSPRSRTHATAARRGRRRRRRPRLPRWRRGAEAGFRRRRGAARRAAAAATGGPAVARGGRRGAAWRLGWLRLGLLVRVRASG